MAFNPNAVFISPSTISSFEKCPQLYYYQSVYRSPRNLKIQLITPALALGATVHDILEQFLKQSPVSRTKDELSRIFNLLWDNISGQKGGFNSQEEEDEARQRAQAMLDRFWAQSHFRQAEPVKLPSFPKVELGNDLILTGKLDWIEKEGDTYHIIDFKTGKNEERENSIQLPIYSVLAGRILKTDKIKTSFWYLDKDEDITPFPKADLDETENSLRQKGEVIKMVRETKSYRCQSGLESCWACRDLHAVAQGRGKLVHVDPVNRKQEIYIIPKEAEPSPTPVGSPAFSFDAAEDLPF
jgi:RecB family exonuclease